MKPQLTHPKPQQETAPRQKQVYATPRLKEEGSFSELTRQDCSGFGACLSVP